MSALLESLLDAERRAECERQDDHQRSETRRILAGEPYLWPAVKWRTDRVQHQPRRERRDSRFGDLTR